MVYWDAAAFSGESTPGEPTRWRRSACGGRGSNGKAPPELPAELNAVVAGWAGRRSTRRRRSRSCGRSTSRSSLGPLSEEHRRPAERVGESASRPRDRGRRDPRHAGLPRSAGAARCVRDDPRPVRQAGRKGRTRHAGDAAAAQARERPAGDSRGSTWPTGSSRPRIR